MTGIINRVIEREGSFVHHPDDAGGPTNMGITQATLSDWYGRPATIDDVRELTKDEAREIYHQRYIVEPGFARIRNDWLREVMVDAGVLWGPSRPTRWLQNAAGVVVDGIFGPVTTEAVNADDPDDLGTQVACTWIVRHGERVQEAPDQAVFIAGWLKRATSHLLMRFTTDEQET